MQLFIQLMQRMYSVMQHSLAQLYKQLWRKLENWEF